MLQQYLKTNEDEVVNKLIMSSENNKADNIEQFLSNCYHSNHEHVIDSDNEYILFLNNLEYEKIRNRLNKFIGSNYKLKILDNKFEYAVIIPKNKNIFKCFMQRVQLFLIIECLHTESRLKRE